MNRRRFLLDLGALCAVAGCTPHAGALSALPAGPIAMGWRWIPGDQHAWRVRVERRTTRVLVQRVEEWTYRVLAVDGVGTAQLEGRLTGFGAGATVDGEPLSDDVVARARAVEQAALEPVTLAVSMAGEVVDIGLDSLARELPHRAVVQRLPRDAVQLGEAWEDTALLRHLAGAIPMEMEVRLTGQTELTAVERLDGRVALRLATEQRASSVGGVVLVLRGDSLWDAERGELIRRRFEVAAIPDVDDDVEQVGGLVVEVMRT